jgi:membrane protease YdiL (CAAX protease family)
MTLPTVIAWFYFQVLSRGDGTANPWQQATYVGGKIIQFPFPFLFVWLVTRKWPQVGPWHRKGLVPAVAFGILVLATILGFYHLVLRDGWLLEPLARAVQVKLAEFNVNDPFRFAILAAFIVFFHSLLEEYYWRWFVFGWLRKLIPLWPAIVVSSLGFMAHHVVVLNAYFPDRFLAAVVPYSLGVAAGGGVWAWLYQRYDSLLGPWMSHLIVDAALMAIGWELLKQPV